VAVPPRLPLAPSRRPKPPPKEHLMMKFMVRSTVAAFALVASIAYGQVDVKIEDPWIRATVPHQMGTGAFMQIKAAKDTRLVAASSPLTPAVEIHEMKLQDN